MAGVGLVVECLCGCGGFEAKSCGVSVSVVDV
jgi:hypothetical protein